MTTRPVHLVLGGCRSGKSRHALDLARSHLGRRNLFIATCVPADAEMKQRVARHRKERSDDWRTLEIPVRLAETIENESRRSDVILVDCLTLWISNLMMKTVGANEIENQIDRLTSALKVVSCPVILVSNEVGTGIVPDNALARRYRDAVGRVNQAVAGVADRVTLLVAGIPVEIKKGR